MNEFLYQICLISRNSGWGVIPAEGYAFHVVRLRRTANRPYRLKVLNGGCLIGFDISASTMNGDRLPFHSGFAQIHAGDVA